MTMDSIWQGSLVKGCLDRCLQCMLYLTSSSCSGIFVTFNACFVLFGEMPRSSKVSVQGSIMSLNDSCVKPAQLGRLGPSCWICIRSTCYTS